MRVAGEEDKIGNAVQARSRSKDLARTQRSQYREPTCTLASASRTPVNNARRNAPALPPVIATRFASALPSLTRYSTHAIVS